MEVFKRDTGEGRAQDSTSLGLITEVEHQVVIKGIKVDETGTSHRWLSLVQKMIGRVDSYFLSKGNIRW